jgi:hypothetical protein
VPFTLYQHATVQDHGSRSKGLFYLCIYIHRQSLQSTQKKEGAGGLKPFKAMDTQQEQACIAERLQSRRL